MIRLALVAGLLMLTFGSAAGQDEAEPYILVEVEPRRLVECPTAGLLPRGTFDFDLRMFPEGGILVGAGVGLMDRFTVGFSFGGEHIIGNRKVDWNPKVEFTAKYRLFEESHALPAVALGFDSQGFGSYDKELNRYAVKSKGFYLAMSKNFSSPLGRMGIHVGVNRSLEDRDGDHDLSGYVGLDKELNAQISVLAEYDFAGNDDDGDSFGSGEGYVNAGLRWTFAERLHIELDFKNLAQNGKGDPNPSREIRIVYMEHF